MKKISPARKTICINLSVKQGMSAWWKASLACSVSSPTLVLALETISRAKKKKEMTRTWLPNQPQIQCVVGRVEDRLKWGLVDRSGPLAHAVFAEVNQSGGRD